MAIRESHAIRSSDSSWYDYKCTKCGATDISGGGLGKLAELCTNSEKSENVYDLNGGDLEDELACS